MSRFKSWPGHVEIDGEVIGDFTVSFPANSIQKPRNVGLFCPDCGDLWGRLLLGVPFVKEHTVIHSPCQKCDGGVIFLHVKTGYLSNWDVDLGAGVLKRDFMLLSDKWLTGGKVNKQVLMCML